MRLLNLPRWIIALVILLAIGFTIALVSRPGLGTQSSKAFPGSLILSLPTPWTAPSGEVVSGLVTYTPSSGTLSYTVAPGTPVFVMPSPGAFSPNGMEVMGIRSGPSTELVVFSLNTQSVVHTVASDKPGSIFESPVWSNDATRIAYLSIPSLDNLPLALDGKPYFVTTGEDVTTLRNDVPLPATYQPGVYVVEGDVKTKLAIEGTAFPVAFSPNGDSVLVREPGTLALASMSGSHVPVSGISDLTTVRGLNVSPSGMYLLALLQDSAVLYKIDWESAALSKVGMLDAHALFGPDDAIVSTTPAGSVTVYQVSGNTLHTSGLYTVPLPIGATVIRWVSAI